MLSLLAGCALGFGEGGEDLVTECVLPADQIGTLSGRWRALPIPIAFHQGDFDEGEVAAMIAAADTWNAFFKASQNIPKVLDYGDSGSVHVSAQPVPGTTCAQGILQGTSYVGQVVIYRQSVWPHSGVGSTMALTSFCTSPGKPLPSTYMAYMELNYQGFFREGLKQPDIQTIITHEFGHLLGLYHSCDPGSKTTGKPDCNSNGISTDYQRAIMFPTFGFNADYTGEQKRALKANDQGRANCLYQAEASTK